MNILDIDLDFFLRERYTDNTEIGRRLNIEDYPIWEEEEVISFLENNCGLNTKSPIKGKIFERHHELLYYIMENGLTDINLYHIDAHEDIHQNHWIEIMRDYMNLSEDKKNNLDNINIYIDEGNFIVFLVACLKLKSVKYINDFNKHGNNIMGIYFKNLDPREQNLQIGILPINYNDIPDIEEKTIQFPSK